MSIDVNSEIYALESAMRAIIKVPSSMYKIIYFIGQIMDEEEVEFEVEVVFSELDDTMGAKKIHTACFVYCRESRRYRIQSLSSFYLFENFYSYLAFPLVKNKEINREVNLVNFLSTFCFGAELFEPFTSYNQLRYYFQCNGPNYVFRYSQNIEKIERDIPFEASIILSFFVDRDTHKPNLSIIYHFEGKKKSIYCHSREDFINTIVSMFICETLEIKREDIRSSHYKILNILNYQ